MAAVSAEPTPATVAKIKRRKVSLNVRAAIAIFGTVAFTVAPATVRSTEQPRRLPDGSIFVPKPMQRLIGLRTIILSQSEVPIAVQLVGRIIADPSATGRVLAPQSGRIDPPDGGFPILGAQVRRGQTLARVVPTLSAQDRSAVHANLAELESMIVIAQQRTQRFSGLVGGLSDRGALEELEDLRARRRVIVEGLSGQRPVEANAAGVLSAINVISGQTVAAREPLFEIVDPTRLWVEAFTYEAGIAVEVASAQAIAGGDVALDLEFAGRGLSIRQMAIPLQFKIVSPPAGIVVGTPATVFVQTHRTVPGFVLPSDAVVRKAEGPPIVLEMPSAERFVLRPVRVQPLDAARVLVTEGLESGTRVVVIGARSIAQIR